MTHNLPFARNPAFTSREAELESCVCQVLQKRSGVTQRVEGVVF
jgi:hypothetical protein